MRSIISESPNSGQSCPAAAGAGTKKLGAMEKIIEDLQAWLLAGWVSGISAVLPRPSSDLLGSSILDFRYTSGLAACGSWWISAFGAMLPRPLPDSLRLSIFGEFRVGCSRGGFRSLGRCS